MITVHCVDISGSMSDEQIAKAQREVLKRFKPRDIVALFDVRYIIVRDLERNFKELYRLKVIGRPSSLATDVLKFAQEQNAKTILYSDGYLVEDQLSQFDEFVEV